MGIKVKCSQITGYLHEKKIIFLKNLINSLSPLSFVAYIFTQANKMLQT